MKGGEEVKEDFWDVGWEEGPFEAGARGNKRELKRNGWNRGVGFEEKCILFLLVVQ